MAQANQSYLLRNRQEIQIWLALYLLGFGMGCLTGWMLAA